MQEGLVLRISSTPPSCGFGGKQVRMWEKYMKGSKGTLWRVVGIDGQLVKHCAGRACKHDICGERLLLGSN